MLVWVGPEYGVSNILSDAHRERSAHKEHDKFDVEEKSTEKKMPMKHGACEQERGALAFRGPLG